MLSERKNIFNVLKNKDFFALWIGQIVSQFGDRLAQMGLVGIYLNKTQGISVAESVPLMRDLFFFSTLPILIFTPLAGVYVDRWGRRNILIITDFVRAVLVVLIPVSVVYAGNISYVYVIIFLIFSVTCFFTPAKLAFIPNLVEKEELLSANSLSNITRMVAMIAGVVIGGFIVARLGITLSFVLDSVSFIASGCAIALVRIKGNPVRDSHAASLLKKIGGDVREGIRFILKNKQVSLLAINLFVSMAASGLAYVLVTVWVTKDLRMGTQGLGIIAAFLGAGMIAGSLLYGQFGGKLRKNSVILGGMLAAGLFVLILGGSGSITFLSLGIFLIGFIAAIIMIAANTFIQEVTPDSVRGRVFAGFEIIINSAFLIFVWVAGVIGALYPISHIFYGIGAVLLAYSGSMILGRTIIRAR